MTQKLNRIMHEHGLDMRPRDQKDARVEPNYKRVLAYLLGFGDTGTFPIKSDIFGAIGVREPFFPPGEWLSGSGPATDLFTPWADYNYDYIEIVWTEGVYRVDFTDLDEVSIHRTHSEIKWYDAVNGAGSQLKIWQTARGVQPTSLFGGTDLLYWNAFRRTETP